MLVSDFNDTSLAVLKLSISDQIKTSPYHIFSKLQKVTSGGDTAVILKY